MHWCLWVHVQQLAGKPHEPRAAVGGVAGSASRTWPWLGPLCHLKQRGLGSQALVQESRGGPSFIGLEHQGKEGVLDGGGTEPLCGHPSSRQGDGQWEGSQGWLGPRAAAAEEQGDWPPWALEPGLSLGLADPPPESLQKPLSVALATCDP